MNPYKPSGHGQGLDWLDRAICIYLLLPLLLFCLWFKTPFAALLLILVGYGAYRALATGKGDPIGISWPWLAGICALSLAWTAISGVGHFFYANKDWITRDAVLHDLTLAGWPPSYLDPNAASLILRAPVGYYLPSAAIGQQLGLDAANVSLYLWTALGFILFLTAACRLFTNHRQRIICLIVLFFFSGMDLLGFLWKARQLPMLGENVEWWLNIIQYPSNTYLLFWVPNHALPAWLGTILIVRHWQQPTLSKITPLLSAAVPLWSPLAAIGLFPFFLFGLAWRRDFKIIFSPRTCLTFLLPALAMATYLVMDAGAIRHGWQINYFPSTGAFVYSYALFCLLEFGLLALILSRLTTFVTTTRIAVVVLCLLPIYVYGPYDDLAMRSSIPALAIIALATVEPLAAKKYSLWHVLLVGVLVIGLLGAIQEPIRAFIGPRWQPQNTSLPNSIRIEDPSSLDPFPSHYFAHPDQRGTNRFLRKPVPGNAVPADNVQ